MHVVTSARSWLIAQLLRDRLHGGGDLPLRLRFGVEGPDLVESARHEHGARPRPKFFRGELLTGDLLQVLVDVSRIHAAHFARLVDILEQFVAREIVALLNDASQAPVIQLHVMILAALPAKPEPYRAR